MSAGGLRRDPGAGLNPFRDHPVRRYAWAWAQLEAAEGAHLEVGVGDGAVLLEAMASRSDHMVVGADAHAGYLTNARQTNPTLPLVRVEVGGRLPFRSASFGSATLLDVLEHVGDEAVTLAELARVLQPGALLVMSVPARHGLSWLDPDDLKYRVPRLHRQVMRRRYPSDAYQRRFVDEHDGLVGDLAANRGHHANYDANDLIGRVMPFGFRPRSRSGANLFGRPLDAARLLASGRLASLIARTVRLDGRFRSANLFLTFERTGEPPLA